MSNENVGNNINVAESTCGVIFMGGSLTVRKITVHAEEKLNLDQYELPPRSETHFVGREDDLEYLTKFFFSYENGVKITVIWGPVGYGKSTLCNKFAYRCLDKVLIDKALWIQADKTESFNQLKKLYKHYKGKKCLYIFDQAINWESIIKYLPKNGLILITIDIESKQPKHEFPSQTNNYNMKPLKPEDAVELLKLMGGEDNRESNEFYKRKAKECKYIPSVLQRYGLLLQNKGILGIVDSTSEKMLQLEDNKYSFNAITHIKRNMTKIDAFVIYACGCLNQHYIYFDDLLEILNTEKSIIEEIVDVKIALNKSLEKLLKLQLIIYKFDDKRIVVNKSNQNFIRVKLNLGDNKCIEQSICYAAFLKYLLKYDNIHNDESKFYILQHFIILKYADDNIDTFFKFYKENEKKLLKGSLTTIGILDEIMNSLFEWKCMRSIEKIIEAFGEQAEKYIKKFCLITKAAFHNNIDILKLLLKYNVDVNHTDSLRIAVLNRNVEIIKILIDYGAYLNESVLIHFFKGIDYFSSIQIDNVINILNLIKFNDNINIKNDEGESLLHIAAISCQANLVQFLIVKYKLLVNELDSKNRTPLCALVSQSQENYISKKRVYSTASILIKCGASLFSSLKECVVLNKIELFNFLLKFNDNVNYIDTEGNTILHIIAFQENLEALRSIMKYKPDLTIKNRNGNTALFEYILNLNANDDIKTVKKWLKLLQCETYINITYNCKKTLLHAASIICHKNLTELLIDKYKMDVNEKDEYDNTPLHSMFKQDAQLININKLCNTAQILISRGALLDIKNNNSNNNHLINTDETPLELMLQSAQDLKSIELLNLVLIDTNTEILKSVFDDIHYCVCIEPSCNNSQPKYSSDTVVQFYNGAKSYIDNLVLLHYSIIWKQYNILELLLKYQANINNRTNIIVNYKHFYNVTALDLATILMDIQAIRILKHNLAHLNVRCYSSNISLFAFFETLRSHEKIDFIKVNEILDLLEFENNKNITNDSGEYILHIVISSLHADLVKYIISKYNLNVNIKDKFGNTPLHKIIMSTNYDEKENYKIINVVKVLMEYNACLDISNIFGKTPVQLAKSLNIKYLLPYLTKSALALDN